MSIRAWDKKLVTDRDALAEILLELESADEVGIDCEFQGEGRYYPLLCLVQLGWNDRAVALDAQKLDLSGLGRVLTERRVRKVFHDGRQDLAILHRLTRAKEINNVFDTRIASGFLGYAMNGGLRALVKEICGVELDKSLQASDWTSSLSAAQIEYALNDVRYLGAISAQLRSALAEKGRLPWLEKACESLVARAIEPNDPDKMFRRLGGSKMTPPQAGVLRALVGWREDAAAKADKPVNYVATDLALKQMALDPPHGREDLAKVRGLGAGKSHAAATRLFDAIEYGRAHPVELPATPPSASRDQRVEGIAGALNLVRRIVATREEIAPELLAEQEDVKALAEWHLEGRPDGIELELLTGWQRSLLGKLLLEVLDGKRAIAVDPADPSGVTLRLTSSDQIEAVSITKR